MKNENIFSNSELIQPYKFRPTRASTGANTYDEYDYWGNNIGSGGEFNTDFSANGFKGNMYALGDLASSRGFSTAVGLGSAISNGIFNYQSLEADRKRDKRMFDLSEGQIKKDNTRIDNMQKNYDSSQKF